MAYKIAYVINGHALGAVSNITPPFVIISNAVIRVKVTVHIVTI